MYFVGIDAGATKTIFVLTNEKGDVLTRHHAGPCTFIYYGAERLTDIMNEGIIVLCAREGIAVRDIAFAALGIPGFDEKEGAPEEIYAVCEKLGFAGNIICECDSYVGWAGSLAMEPGVNITAGTGSICFGVDNRGNTARSGGWGVYCDEGSCRWLGERLIALFTKQADGRLPRTALYEIFRHHFNITEDLHFITTLNHDLNYTKTAQLQVLLCDAHGQGDEHAKALYGEAAYELALGAAAVADKLGLPEGYAVSYSGGLFRSGDCILKPLAQRLAEGNGVLVKPKHPPELGAALMAMGKFFPGRDFKDFTFNERNVRAW
jgi:N-acetylglucosamine kinase-like BadF-type ATPase